MKNYFEYSGQTVVVTGAASGMGKATSEILVDLGAKVYALDYAKVEIPGIELALQVDISSREQIDEVFNQLPNKIDKFFGVAGVSGQQHDFTTTTVINFLANKYMVEEYLENRIAENGAIVFVSSLGALYWENHLDEMKQFMDAKGWDETYKAIADANKDNEKSGVDGYTLAKRLINYFTLDKVKYFSKKKVRLNVIMPAGAKTGLTKEFADTVGGEENLFMGYAGRIATPEEMANAMIFLNSEMATYINGITLYVDAGHTVPETLGEQEKMLDFSLFTGESPFA